MSMAVVIKRSHEDLLSLSSIFISTTNIKYVANRKGFIEELGLERMSWKILLFMTQTFFLKL